MGMPEPCAKDFHPWTIVSHFNSLVFIGKAHASAGSWASEQKLIRLDFLSNRLNTVTCMEIEAQRKARLSWNSNSFIAFASLTTERAKSGVIQVRESAEDKTSSSRSCCLFFVDPSRQAAGSAKREFRYARVCCYMNWLWITSVNKRSEFPFRAKIR